MKTPRFPLIALLATAATPAFATSLDPRACDGIVDTSRAFEAQGASSEAKALNDLGASFGCALDDGGAAPLTPAARVRVSGGASPGGSELLCSGLGALIDYLAGVADDRMSAGDFAGAAQALDAAGQVTQFGEDNGCYFLYARALPKDAACTAVADTHNQTLAEKSDQLRSIGAQALKLGASRGCTLIEGKGGLVSAVTEGDVKVPAGTSTYRVDGGSTDPNQISDADCQTIAGYIEQIDADADAFSGAGDDVTAGQLRDISAEIEHDGMSLGCYFNYAP